VVTSTITIVYCPIYIYRKGWLTIRSSLPIILNYRHYHRRNTSVGFTFVGNSIFHRYIGRKNKKTFADGFTYGHCAPKKKVSRLKYTDGFSLIGDSVTYRWIKPSVKLSVTDLISIGNSVGEVLKYRLNISVCKFVGDCGSYYEMPTD